MGVMMVVMVISFNRHFESRKFKNAGLGDSRLHKLFCSREETWLLRNEKKRQCQA
jgi:predicted acetyltransferase